MKFLDSFTPDQINKLCKEFKVKVQITAVHHEEDEIIFFENGEKVLRTEERIELQSSREIRSWSDLFQYDNKNALYLTDNEKELLK